MNDNYLKTKTPFTSKFDAVTYFEQECYDAYKIIDAKDSSLFYGFLKVLLDNYENGNLMLGVVNDRLYEIESYLQVRHGYLFAKIFEEAVIRKNDIHSKRIKIDVTNINGNLN
jgi:hypothetical protein